MLKGVLGEIFRRIAGHGGRPAAGSGPDAEASLAHGLGCHQRGDLAGAEQAYRAALKDRPGHGQALHLLGHVLGLRGKLEESVELLSRAAALLHDDADVQFNLAQTLSAQDRVREAEQALRRALRIQPRFVGAWVSLAGVLIERGSLDQAEDCYREALDIDPAFAEGHYNLGNLLHREGRIAESIACYRKSIELRPDFVRAHSNLVYALNFSDEYSPEQIFREHLEWARCHAEPLNPGIRPHPNSQQADRLLRIGYVSPNFRSHAVSYFFEPVLMNHDPGRVAVYCYSDVERSDRSTERLRGYRSTWREIAGESDDAVAEMVRRDGIDILVDLTGHTDGHRLLVFARKPAPLQLTWNGYANTTGMAAMDYRITDAYADPLGTTEHLHSERLIRLPQIYMAFKPPVESPDVGPLPVFAKGHATFGSFNAISKLTPRVIEVWSRLLREVADARLLLLTAPEGRTRERLRDAFARHGVDPGRIDFRDRLPFPEFLAAQLEVDVALDPFPFSGTTTTCHSLWMGVPVVTLAGKSHVSRVGVSMLSNLKLERLVARDDQDYVEIAAALTRETGELASLRAALRDRMANAPNTNGARLTRFLEQAYVTIWAEYCRQHAAV
ncbi:MAG: tetratricopeptide repeat protein [Betaproteobacteria bacterium]|nr:tetratricopeptide repeat protein [Betaproteobacteria bacterium]